MKKQRLFGTDGVRGIANTEITPELAFKLGKAGAHVLNSSQSNPLFIVGCDTRISGDMLTSSLISGLLSSGANVINTGVIPTPAIAYLVRELNATAGVMISASHNPYQYNGIKFFNKEGFKLSDALEDQIQSLIENDFINTKPCVNDSIGICTNEFNLDEKYVEFLLSTTTESLKGLRIALDCGHGATYKIAESVFKKLGANVITINTQPNGLNINKNCGSTHLEQLKELVIQNDFDMGFAFDGDGDRCLAIDNHGNTINGDKILAICSHNMIKKNMLSKNTVVATVMSNLGFIKAMENINVNVIQANVGDRYVLEAMLKDGYNLGGEESGHVIFLDHNTTGDGLLTAVQIASICSETQTSLHELASIMTEYPQTLINVPIDNSLKHTVFNHETLSKKIQTEEASLQNDGRVLVRVSGTEPLIRVMVEGSNDNLINTVAHNIADTVVDLYKTLS